MKRKGAKGKDTNKVRFHNTRHTFDLPDGRSIPPDTVFKANPEDVPKAFHDVIVPLDDDNKEEKKDVKSTEDENAGPQEEDVEIPQLRITHRGGGYYDVVDFYGDYKNEKAMRLDDAKQMIRDLTGEEPEEPQK